MSNLPQSIWINHKAKTELYNHKNMGETWSEVIIRVLAEYDQFKKKELVE